MNKIVMIADVLYLDITIFNIKNSITFQDVEDTVVSLFMVVLDQ